MKVLVTGGGGFLGKAIVQRLVSRGDAVRSLSRSTYPGLDDLCVDQIRGNLADYAAVSRAVVGCDLVFHVAAKAGVWGPESEYRDTNVIGTKNVINACRRHKVGSLVYTSTPSVIHSGKDVEGANESLPYAKRFDAAYPKTKAEAERMVLRANSGDLATTALRPHLIWGPEDNHLVPKIIDRFRQGKLRLVGGGKKLVDSVYIDNAALAHIQAGDSLVEGGDCDGKAYFITQGRPWPMHRLINGILKAAGMGPVKRSVSPGVAYAAGWFYETTYRLFGNENEPPMTRFVARQLATAHWYDISAATRDFGYKPVLTIEDGLRRLRAWFGGRTVQHEHRAGPGMGG